MAALSRNAGQVQIARDTDFPPGVIDKSQREGDSGRERQVVKPGPPVLGALPGAFWRECEQKALPRGELVGKPRDRSRPRAAIDRDAAPTPEKGSQRTSKQRILADPMHVEVERPFGQQPDDEIPVRGVGVENNHRLLRHRLDDHRPPAAKSEHRRRKPGAQAGAGRLSIERGHVGKRRDEQNSGAVFECSKRMALGRR